MNIGRAYAIFDQIDSDQYAEQEKLNAIKQILAMPTHNGVTKSQIVNAFRWVFDYAFEVAKKPETQADRIRAMTDEELAKKILSTDEAPAYTIPFCKNSGRCTDILDSGEAIPDELCKQCLMEWLKSPVEE